MQEDRKDSFLFLLYKALVEIRWNSSIYNRLDLFNQDDIRKYLKQINKLADIYHNLPLYLQSGNHEFDENNFLDFLSKSNPGYKELFDKQVNAKLDQQSDN